MHSRGGSEKGSETGREKEERKVRGRGRRGENERVNAGRGTKKER